MIYAQHFKRETSIALLINKHFALVNPLIVEGLSYESIPKCVLLSIYTNAGDRIYLVSSSFAFMQSRQSRVTTNAICIGHVQLLSGNLIIAEFQKLRCILGVTQITPQTQCKAIEGSGTLADLKPLSLFQDVFVPLTIGDIPHNTMLLVPLPAETSCFQCGREISEKPRQVSEKRVKQCRISRIFS